MLRGGVASGVYAVRGRWGKTWCCVEIGWG